MNPESLNHVFKAYDIRGLSPSELDPAFAERLGRAIAARFTPKSVLVGRDMRQTSTELEAALIEGLVSSGVNVTRIGLCSTPLFNVTIGLSAQCRVPSAECPMPFDLGVMVTASHNPGEYNGFKITKGDCLPVGQGTGMEELRDAFVQGSIYLSDVRGTVTDDPVALDRYVSHILSLAKLPDDMPRMDIAIDAGNGMAGAVLPELLKRLPWLTVRPLYFEPDGTFPNHEANPLKTKTLTDLIRTLHTAHCALGVAFDGDADRVGFVDETGEQIPGDVLTALLAEEVLAEHPDGLVLYDVRSSWSVPRAVTESGGHSEKCKVGHANIKRAMREKSASFGGELSMHFYFKELWNCESGDLAMLLILRRLARESKAMSALWAPLRRYAKSEETNYTVTDAAAVMKHIETRYASSASATSKLDGLRMEFGNGSEPTDWWFSVRASNTEPLLRLNVEAGTEEMLAAKMKELAGAIQS